MISISAHKACLQTPKSGSQLLAYSQADGISAMTGQQAAEAEAASTTLTTPQSVLHFHVQILDEGNVVGSQRLEAASLTTEQAQLGLQETDASWVGVLTRTGSDTVFFRNAWLEPSKQYTLHF